MCVFAIVYCQPNHASVCTYLPADGTCAQPASGVLLPERYPPPFPTPLAYFPLSRDLAQGDTICECTAAHSCTPGWTVRHVWCSNVSQTMLSAWPMLHAKRIAHMCVCVCVCVCVCAPQTLGQTTHTGAQCAVQSSYLTRALAQRSCATRCVVFVLVFCTMPEVAERMDGSVLPCEP